MTTPALTNRSSDDVPRWTHPVGPAQPANRAAVEEALAKIRAWSPYDGDAWLDDVADALDSVPPAEEEIEELGQRLRGHLMQLVSIALNGEAERRDERAFSRIHRACGVREEEMPGDYGPALALLRRMGWAVNELLDLLVEIGAVKKPDSLTEPPPAPDASRRPTP
ncbi:DUF6415 family natural product biosynthesis protein [Streptomyces sp. SCSIO 30461]|uniref:DUF6415 family natural product biosynthesis protein n=1 Tax=Streptomyces sp. SCSIO 30461 TaxID=3118085 RepID=UPI0030CBC49B